MGKTTRMSVKEDAQRDPSPVQACSTVGYSLTAIKTMSVKMENPLIL